MKRSTVRFWSLAVPVVALAAGALFVVFPVSFLGKTSSAMSSSLSRDAERTELKNAQRYPAGPRSLTSRRLSNASAYIPPQCYTRTKDESGRVHNPCYTCHVRSRAPNYIKDADLQLEYSFPAPARRNPWTNLFVDRRNTLAAIGDQETLAYVREDNYLDASGNPRLRSRLVPPPATWDEDGDGRFSGFIPDAYFRFDEAGFDRAPDGRPTGWRVFAYYPFEGTFFPTNGSAGDVLIRLPSAFRQSAAGEEDLLAYRINLAVLEALIKRSAVAIEPVDERVYGVDLDQDGKFGRAVRVGYVSVPTGGRGMRYVGGAGALQDMGQVKAIKGLFPQGAEFLHSVRYLDVREGRVTMAARMKELRYARKASFVGRLELEQLAAAETKEKRDFPDRLRSLTGSFEAGIANGQGWRYQGFIEDGDGELRPQTFEETAFCVGCHGGVGATVDGIFSFARKLDADQAPMAQGWFHPLQRDLRGVVEPRRADGGYEYTRYLIENGAGDELRANGEVIERFMAADGSDVRQDAVEALHNDVALLLWPSPARALALDKVYRAVVQEQSFHLGRDAMLSPAQQVHRSLDAGVATGVSETVPPPWADAR